MFGGQSYANWKVRTKEVASERPKLLRVVTDETADTLAVSEDPKHMLQYVLNAFEGMGPWIPLISTTNPMVGLSS